MKVAVLGPSPAAINITRELLQLGAAVRLFWNAPVVAPELQQWVQDGVVILAPWHQVTKRFLLAGEKPGTKSRFADLFRVSYLINPEPLIEQSKTDQPEVYEKLTAEFMASLKRQLEMFEDVDVVIDASAGVSRRELGPGGPAIGESRLRDGTIVYGSEFNDVQFINGATELALVGDGREAAEALQKLQTWWQDKKHRLFHISTTARPFEKFLSEDHGSLNKVVTDFIKTAQTERESERAAWELKLAEWQELDDFIKAKKPRPEEPIPRYVVFSGHIVSGVDQLVDKSRSFLTIETSPFVSGEVHPENSQLELKTIGVDRIIVAAGTRRPWERFYGLELTKLANEKDAKDANGIHPEAGFFTLGYQANDARQTAIIQQLHKLFSPRTP